MSDTVVRVENLAKRYDIRHLNQPANSTLKDAITSGAKSLSRILTPGKNKTNPNREEFWALKNLSFEIKQGDVVGIIGRNGAGKSTLLKILSRITEPTKGRISIKGRVASLLEVGTGFHPELTGRENIYLNGAILGMSRIEIKRKFDEIVDFAEVEKFLDTPVKHYSSGMYVRLAFAVAAHLEPEILIVDEVLAVGDVQFQKKCLGKMGNVAKEGRTILFVSHNMSTVESLCNRGVLLEAGTVGLDGTADEAVRYYLERAYGLAKELPLIERRDRAGNGKVRACSFRILNEQGEEEPALQSGKNYYFEIGYTNNTGNRINNAVVCLDLLDERGMRVMLLKSTFTNHELTLNPGKGFVLCGIKNLPVVQGLYRATLHISYADREVFDHIEDAVTVSVDGGDFFGTGNPGIPNLCKFL
ncbi:MAG TPA: ABC transporter ATP-binding protein, partial [Cyanobacteria bacterium UBA11049]|nr:ABC transporter ATP-binding protein [Cyanobacteria bacterium UBA11049]